MKPVSFIGNSLDAVRAFPDSARREAGFQIDRLQRGLDPEDWKPMATIGAGVREIRVRDATGAFRVIYIARSQMPCTCCTPSPRRRKQRQNATLISPRRGSGN